MKARDSATTLEPSSPPRRTNPSGIDEIYAGLLSGTHKLQREQRAERKAWLAALELDRKSVV